MCVRWGDAYVQYVYIYACRISATNQIKSYIPPPPPSPPRSGVYTSQLTIQYHTALVAFVKFRRHSLPVLFLMYACARRVSPAGVCKSGGGADLGLAAASRLSRRRGGSARGWSGTSGDTFGLLRDIGRGDSGRRVHGVLFAGEAEAVRQRLCFIFFLRFFSCCLCCSILFLFCFF